MIHRTIHAALLGMSVVLLAAGMPVSAAAQTGTPQKPVQPPPKTAPATQKQKPAQPPPAAVQPAPVVPPAGYVIGADDVLIVMFRREKDMSAEVVVRPDGKITLPLLNDVEALGLTPDELRARITELAKRLVEEPSVTVAVKAINSRRVFITGQVGKPGAYPIGDKLTVMQLISMAGGLLEYAKKKDIVIIREAPSKPGAKPATFKFNYEDIQKLKNLGSNIELRPGDTVIVP